MRREKEGKSKLLDAAAYAACAVTVAAQASAMGGEWNDWATLGAMLCFVALLPAIFASFRRPGKFLFALVVGLQWGLGAFAAFEGIDVTLGAVFLIVLCAIVAFRVPPAVGILLGAASTAALGLGLALRAPGTLVTATLGYSSGFIPAVAFASPFRDLSAARARGQRLLAELAEAQDRVRTLAVVEERQRIAREMHDAVGHRMAASAVLLEGAARLISGEPARAAGMVETARVQLREGLGELRGAVSALREGPARSLDESLRALAELHRRGAGCEARYHPAGDLSSVEEELALVVLRAAQEGLTNAAKHACASRIDLYLTRADGKIVFRCEDDGEGPPPPGKKGGFGLGNLAERAAARGGTAALLPRAGGGSVLRLELPDRGPRAVSEAER